MWNGTASSAVDLHPTSLIGFTTSVAWGTSGTQQVGAGSGSATNGNNHALLWSGSADSAVDLSPTNIAGILFSTAFDTNGAHQVGFGFGSSGISFEHALLWSSTADTTVDLHLLLPTGFKSSAAFAIDAQGNIYGTASSTNGAFHAVEWVPVPEPVSVVLVALGLPAIWAIRQLGSSPI
jgi:hypothetical protein